MTIIEPSLKVCGFCKSKIEVFDLFSSSQYDCSDLDSRPAKPYRSTMNSWVTRCIDCGFCSNDITSFSQQNIGLIKSESYQNQLNDSLFGELANSFLCHSMILKHEKRVREAALSTLCAAWCCDDSKDYQAAIECRKKVDVLLSSIAQTLEHNSYDHLLHVDVLRRANQFDRAIERYEQVINQVTDISLNNLLKFERELSYQGDNQSYKVDMKLH